MRNWTLAFVKAYERNRIIVREAGDKDMNLTDIVVYADIVTVTRPPAGWVFIVEGLVSTKYESGAHGDRSLNAGYVVNETTVRRIALDDTDDRIDPTDGTVILDCRE